MDPPDLEYNTMVRFSKFIKLPSNATEWTHANEGKQRMNITYHASEETLTILYDQDLSIDLSWKVVEVGIEKEEQEDIPENLQSDLNNMTGAEKRNETQMISVNWLKIKLDFTLPKVVSSRVRDSIKIEVLQDMFDEETFFYSESQALFVNQNPQDYTVRHRIQPL